MRKSYYKFQVSKHSVKGESSVKIQVEHNCFQLCWAPVCMVDTVIRHYVVSPVIKVCLKINEVHDFYVNCRALWLHIVSDGRWWWFKASISCGMSMLMVMVCLWIESHWKRAIHNNSQNYTMSNKTEVCSEFKWHNTVLTNFAAMAVNMYIQVPEFPFSCNIPRLKHASKLSIQSKTVELTNN